MKRDPVISIINFDASAHKFSNGFAIFLKKSRPPKKMIRPRVTTICMSNFFLLGIKIAKKDKISIGSPKIEGIKEVKESLPVILVIHNPQIIRKIPYEIEIFSIFNPKNVYSLFIIIYYSRLKKKVIKKKILNMKKTLILFSTTDGQTKIICEKIYQALHNRESIQLISINQYKDINIQEFDTVVVGASIRYGKHSLKIQNFIKENKKILDNIKTAFFSVNVVARKSCKNTPLTNPYVIKFLKKLNWNPNITAVFAGKINYPSYKFIDKQMIRLIMYITKGPTDTSKNFEFTDWNKVDDFSRDLENLINLN